MFNVKILVCENNHMVFQAIKGALQNESYNLHWAVDGRQALEIMKREPFDLLLTEILLPFCSGLELIHILRSKLLATLPILVLSMINSTNTVDLACQLGATEYMPKPFAPEKLKSRIADLLLKEKISLLTTNNMDHNYNLQY